MVIYPCLITFYRIEDVNYVGSCIDLNERLKLHKSVCYNENVKGYNIKLYEFIRDNQLPFDELEFQVLMKRVMNSDEERRITEQGFVVFYNSKINGLNDRNAYTSPEEYKEKHNEISKRWKINNVEKNKEFNKIYNEKNKGRIKNWMIENKEHREEYMNGYYNRNSILIKERAKKYYQEKIIKTTCEICGVEINNINLFNHKKVKHIPNIIIVKIRKKSIIININCSICNEPMNKNSLLRHCRTKHRPLTY